MKNFISGAQDESWTFNKLKPKIFSGKPQEVEAEIKDFINNNPIEIKSVTQSRGDDRHPLIITLLYYSKGKPQFIDQRWTITMLTDLMEKEVEKIYGFTFVNIMEAIWDKEKEK